MTHAQISEVASAGALLKFQIRNPRDHIQKRHLNGTLYEAEELNLIREYFPKGGFFCMKEKMKLALIFAENKKIARRAYFTVYSPLWINEVNPVIPTVK